MEIPKTSSSSQDDVTCDRDHLCPDLYCSGLDCAEQIINNRRQQSKLRNHSMSSADSKIILRRPKTKSYPYSNSTNDYQLYANVGYQADVVDCSYLSKHDENVATDISQGDDAPVCSKDLPAGTTTTAGGSNIATENDSEISVSNSQIFATDAVCPLILNTSFPPPMPFPSSAGSDSGLTPFNLAHFYAFDLCQHFSIYALH